MADQEIIAHGTTVAMSPAPTGASIMHNVSEMWNQPVVRKAMPAIAGIGAVGIAAMAWALLSSPAQAPLFQGLSEADKASVAQALEASGIDYSLDPGAGSITVSEDEVHKARMLLAGQGLPKAAPSGDTLLASLPMGSSRAVEGETLRSARATDLSRTIEEIDAVKSARVHLATPEPSVFVRDQSPPAASVMLTLESGRSLSNAQVKAIRHLVASSVPGLDPAQVSVVDQSGDLLSQPDAIADDPILAYQESVEGRYRESLLALLGPVVGRDNFSVEVHADIDTSESQSTRESYPKDDNALRSEQGNRTNQAGGPPPAVGIPGALSNQPPQNPQLANTPGSPPQTATAGGGGQSDETYARTFDVGREISVTHKPQGAVRRLTVAVALRNLGSKPRSAAEIAAIDGLVKGAVGFDAARGDVVAITSRPFASTAEVEPPFYEAPWFMPLLRQIGAGIVALLILFFVGRPMMRAFKKRAEERDADRETIEQQLLAMGGGKNPAARQVTLEMIEAAPSYETRANLVRAFVRQDSERAALVLRQLMQEQANG